MRRAKGRTFYRLGAESEIEICASGRGGLEMAILSEGGTEIKERVILSGVPLPARREGTESKDLGGSINRSTLMNRRGPSTALRPPFRLRSAQDDTSMGISGTSSQHSPVVSGKTGANARRLSLKHAYDSQLRTFSSSLIGPTTATPRRARFRQWQAVRWMSAGVTARSLRSVSTGQRTRL